MMGVTALLGILLVLIFCFTLTNGFLDGGGIVSTVVTTRALEPLPAVMLVACCEVIGVFLFGHAVIRTIGLHMITFPSAASAQQTMPVLLAATAGALAWNSAMWHYSWPSSSSHALLGGLLGATWVRFGKTAIAWPVVLKVLVGLAAVPLIAGLVSLALARLLYWAGQYLTPAWARVFRWLHISVSAGVALVHGSNDGQKSMALVLLAFMAGGRGVSGTHLPVWVGLLCGVALGLGVVFGSQRTLHTIGQGLYRMENMQGLCAETSAMLLVAASSLAGYPMSTSHVMSSSVIGAGAAVRPRDVRWDLAGSIGLAWLLTIPAAAGFAGTLSYVVSKAF